MDFSTYLYLLKMPNRAKVIRQIGIILEDGSYIENK